MIKKKKIKKNTRVKLQLRWSNQYKTNTDTILKRRCYTRCLDIWWWWSCFHVFRI